MAASPMILESRDLQVEIEAANQWNTTWVVAFSANGQYLISGDEKNVRVWQVADGKEMATMESGWVGCLAVSNDGNWIAAGTQEGVFMWDAKTYEKVWQHNWSPNYILHAVDFSPNSTRVIVPWGCIVTVFDVATLKPAFDPFPHQTSVLGAKYSPNGDRIATGSEKSVRVWDSNNGRLLMEVEVEPYDSYFNNCLLWFDDHLFVAISYKMRRIDASNGSTALEWPTPKSATCIALPHHGKFIACCSHSMVSFWDTSTYTQLGLVRWYSADIRSISFSPDDRFIALCGESGKITIKSVSAITISMISFRLCAVFQESDAKVDLDSVLDLWIDNKLVDAEALLSRIISSDPRVPGHLAFACRALVRARLQECDAAMVDAEKSIELRPSSIGYVSKAVVFAGKGERQKAYLACDFALMHGTPDKMTGGILHLLKAIVMFMAGEHDAAISRVDELILMAWNKSLCYVVRAYMFLLVGRSYMERKDFDGAMRSFERAQAQWKDDDMGRVLAVISLISGWKFDDLEITLKRLHCEVIYAAGCSKGVEEFLRSRS